MQTSNPAVVVAADGSPPALRAVRLAAAEARRRNRPLRVVHAFAWHQVRVPIAVLRTSPSHGLRQQAEHIVGEAVREAAKAAPRLTVTGEVVDGDPATVLVRESQHAALIVLGDRGLGGFAALLLGSIATQVSTHAECPVLVARGAEHSDGPIVVGVDGSPLSQQAVTFAAETAAMRQIPVVAIHTYQHPASTGPGDMQPLVYDERQLRDEESRVLAESIAGLAERYPQMPVTSRVVRGRAAQHLIAESERAQMVVVGAHGHSTLTGLVLGSVSHALLHHAACPVAIVRPARA